MPRDLKRAAALASVERTGLAPLVQGRPQELGGAEHAPQAQEDRLGERRRRGPGRAPRRSDEQALGAAWRTPRALARLGEAPRCATRARRWRRSRPPAGAPARRQGPFASHASGGRLRGPASPPRSAARGPGRGPAPPSVPTRGAPRGGARWAARLSTARCCAPGRPSACACPSPRPETRRFAHEASGTTNDSGGCSRARGRDPSEAGALGRARRPPASRSPRQSVHRSARPRAARHSVLRRGRRSPSPSRRVGQPGRSALLLRALTGVGAQPRAR